MLYMSVLVLLVKFQSWQLPPALPWISAATCVTPNICLRHWRKNNTNWKIMVTGGLVLRKGGLHKHKTCFIFPAATQQSPPGEAVCRRVTVWMAWSIVFHSKHTNPVRNSSLCVPRSIYPYTPQRAERPSLARTKGISLSVAKPVKSEA